MQGIFKCIKLHDSFSDFAKLDKIEKGALHKDWRKSDINNVNVHVSFELIRCMSVFFYIIKKKPRKEKACVSI